MNDEDQDDAPTMLIKLGEIRNGVLVPLSGQQGVEYLICKHHDVWSYERDARCPKCD